MQSADFVTIAYTTFAITDKYAMERMGHSSTNMLKNVYQHTMISKEEEVSVQVDNYFEENLHTDLHTGE